MKVAPQCAATAILLAGSRPRLHHTHARAALHPCPPAVGASNLGHIILYGLLNQQEGLLCDRAYYPGEDMQVRRAVAAMRPTQRAGTSPAVLTYLLDGSNPMHRSSRFPPRTSSLKPALAVSTPLSGRQALLAKYGKRLFGVESRRPLSDFDVLGFSLSYELGGTNILEMLRQAGVAQTWKVLRGGWGGRTGSAPVEGGVAGRTGSARVEPQVPRLAPRLRLACYCQVQALSCGCTL